MQPFKLTLFAGFHFTDNKDKPLPVSSRKSKALLAWLALHPDHQHQREKLASILWPDSHETQARHSLRQALADLKKALPENSELLQTTKDWISLDSRKIEIDTLNFGQAIAKGDEKSLEYAVNLYRGELLEGCNPHSDIFDDWLLGYRSNYSEQASASIEHYLGILIDKEKYDRAIQISMQLLSIDELKESAYRTLVLSHSKLGDYASAIKWYQRCKKIMKQELGVSPSQKTENLYQQINKRKQLIANKRTSLANNEERLLYLVGSAITGIIEHNIGQSFLIRGKSSKEITIAKEIVKLAQSQDFFYCHKEVLTTKDQTNLIGLSQVLTEYLFDSPDITIQQDNNISKEAHALIKKFSSDQPILLLIEHIHRSNIDLQILLAELVSLIGNNAILLVMTTNFEDDPLGPTIKGAMIGAPLTTVDIDLE